MKVLNLPFIFHFPIHCSEKYFVILLLHVLSQTHKCPPQSKYKISSKYPTNSFIKSLDKLTLILPFKVVILPLQLSFPILFIFIQIERLKEDKNPFLDLIKADLHGRSTLRLIRGSGKGSVLRTVLEAKFNCIFMAPL